MTTKHYHPCVPINIGKSIELLQACDQVHNGVQFELLFETGYTMVVMQHDLSFGREEGLYEVRIKRGPYSTDRGYLTEEEVVLIIEQMYNGLDLVSAGLRLSDFDRMGYLE